MRAARRVQLAALLASALALSGTAAADHRPQVAARAGIISTADARGADAALTVTESVHALLAAYASGSGSFAAGDAPLWLCDLGVNARMQKGAGLVPSVFVGTGYLWTRGGEFSAPEMHATASWKYRQRMALYVSVMRAARDGRAYTPLRAGATLKAWPGGK